jgi:hypothetical protein
MLGSGQGLGITGAGWWSEIGAVLLRQVGWVLVVAILLERV